MKEISDRSIHIGWLTHLAHLLLLPLSHQLLLIFRSGDHAYPVKLLLLLLLEDRRPDHWLPQPAPLYPSHLHFSLGCGRSESE